MKILAIGADMKDGVAALLRAIDRPEGLMVDHFDLADSSSAALEHAKPMMQDWTHCIDFKVLDLDKDLKGQGFESESYDVIIAANTLYSVKNITSALKQVRKLIKPGGKIVIVELIRPPTLAIETIFGVLPGYVRSSPGSQQITNKPTDGGPLKVTSSVLPYFLNQNGMKCCWKALSVAPIL